MKKFLAILFSVVILATFMAVPAFAADSPEGEVVHTVKMPDGSIVGVDDGDSITLTPSNPDADFEAWEIDGEYTIVSGDLKSEELVIIPHSDLVVKEIYSDVVVQDPEADENESDKAPQTGNDTIMMVVLLTAGAFVAMVATKKAVRA